jgi:hypothetical protein
MRRFRPWGRNFQSWLPEPTAPRYFFRSFHLRNVIIIFLLALQMTKHAQQKPTFFPPHPLALVPEPDRTDEKLEDHIQTWLTQRTAMRGLHGPEFVAWLKKVTDQNREILGKLFHRYGIEPSWILDTLEIQKRHLLSREQLESGLWLKEMSGSVARAARLGLPDTELAKIQRNRKLRDQKAKVLEEAATVLDNYPNYMVVFLDVQGPDQIVFDLPKYIRAIAVDIRQQGRAEKHRPEERAAKSILHSLTLTFEHLVNKPLYEYAGLLTKTSFPEEWNPAGDIREAAKKLVKSFYRQMRERRR